MLNYVPAHPVVEVVGCPNRGVDTVLYRRPGRYRRPRRYRRPGRLGPMRSPGGPADCRHGDAPFWAMLLAPQPSGRGTG